MNDTEATRASDTAAKRTSDTASLRVTVNSRPYQRNVPARLLLSDFLRDALGLTGTHVGCEHGVCGACTILLDGVSIRSCLMLAVQADGATIETVESLGTPARLSALQRSFHQHHALQCGFCTPGILMTCEDLLRNHAVVTEAEIRAALSGNLCRCTGYDHIVRAIRAAIDAQRQPA
jgi:aerobic carbon-monoxide dehydrogenase small subunit